MVVSYVTHSGNPLTYFPHILSIVWRWSTRYEKQMGFRENIGDHHILIVTVRFYKNLLREPVILRLE